MHSVYARHDALVQHNLPIEAAHELHWQDIILAHHLSRNGLISRSVGDERLTQVAKYMILS